MESENNSNYSILIVDDVAKNIQLVAKFLTKEGYTLNFAQNGEIALKLADNKLFDLILLDIMMPGMDGFEVCRKIKENKKNQSVPIIFLTAKTDDEAIKKGFSSGGVDYITKPFNPEELLARVRTHLVLQKREQELIEINNTKDTLLSIISHDLKTPFFNIMGLGEIIITNFTEFPDEQKVELLTNIVDSARASHNLLDNLLSWTRMQTGKIAFNPVKFSINEFIRLNISLARFQAENKGVRLIFDDDTKINVFADENMVNTILRNLLSNAIKYTPRSGKVLVRLEQSDNMAKISVVDNGIGIPPEKVETLFLFGKTVSTPGTNQENGSGFGLVITNDFVKLNKGTLSLESAVGKGSTFSFTLPLD
jgi:two-component system, sensor histidine kinase and response regulator